MTENLPSLEELMKQAAEKGIELPDDLTEFVDGGAYTREEWKAMSTEERIAAQNRSLAARLMGTPCEMDPGVPHP